MVLFSSFNIENTGYKISHKTVSDEISLSPRHRMRSAEEEKNDCRQCFSASILTALRHQSEKTNRRRSEIFFGIRQRY